MVGFAALAGAVSPRGDPRRVRGRRPRSVASDRVEGADELDAPAGESRGPAEVRAQLETIGFGLMAPLFFVTAGLRFDLGARRGALEPAAASAIVSAALISVVTLPTLVRWLLRSAPGAVPQDRSAPAPA